MAFFLYGYTRRAEEVRRPEALTPFLNEMSAQGFLIIGSAERGTRRAWMRHIAAGAPSASVPAELQTPGISALAKAAIQQFNAGQSEQLALILLALVKTPPLDVFHFALDLDTTQGTIQASADERDFTRYGKADEQQYDQWLATLQRIYTAWHPLLAFTISEHGDFLTTREQALAFTPAYLYDVNFFGPEIVAALGRDRLAALNAWKLTNLDDGGMLLVPAPFNTLDAPYDYAAMAERLGLAQQDFLNAPQMQPLLDALSEQANRSRAQRQANTDPPKS